MNEEKSQRMREAFSATSSAPLREMIGICGENSEEWVIGDIACIVHNMISVPMYSGSSPSDLLAIVNQTKLNCVVSSLSCANKFIEVAEQSEHLQVIIVMDASPSEVLDLKRKNSIPKLSIFGFSEIEKMGFKSRSFHQPSELTDGDVITIVFSSGSTGVPKGMKFNHLAWKTAFSKIYRCPDPYVCICYEPLAHASNRKNAFTTWIAGGRVGIFQRPLEYLFEDTSELGVSVFDGTPLIFNRIYAEYKKEIALATSKFPNKKSTEIEDEVMERFKDLLGKRLFSIVMGGAPCSKEVANFIRICFRCGVYESYGTTETGGIYFDNIMKSNVGHRLENVPEMGYFTTDKPYPRGELLVKSQVMTAGYLDEAENAKSFTSDGFFRTGDIVMQTSPDAYTIIDRKKMMYKLSTGEFIAPHAIENILLQSDFVYQIFVHGDPMRSFVVAVVVPNKEVLLNWAKENNVQGNFDEICKSEKVNTAVLSSLTIISIRNHLRSYEIPRGLILDPEPFTVENSKLTATLKNSRPFLLKHYKNQMEELMNFIENSRSSVTSKLKEIVKKAMGADYNENLSLIDMGADSLSTVRLASLIKEKLNVEVPVDLLFSETTINEITDFIESKNEKKISSIERRVNEIPFDISEETKLPFSFKEVVSKAIIPDVYIYNDVFLTGATGFLGVYILKELLKRKYQVHCLVRYVDEKFQWKSEFIYSERHPVLLSVLTLFRASNVEDGMNRIIKNMELHKIWKESWRKQIVPIIGDLSLPLFGLSEDEFSKLTFKIDMIYHSGAKVNGVMPYASHRLPNVQGTKEVVRLGCTSKIKPIHFVSTIGVTSGLPLMDEESDLDKSNLSYLGGYNQSKWISEQIIWNLGKTFPYTVFRPGFIGASSKTGCSNKEDYLNRLIVGLIQLKKYPNDVTNTNNVIPVDFVAKAIIGLSLETESLRKAFHLVNPNGFLTMKMIADAIKSSGYEVQGVPYADWRAELYRLAQESSSLGEKGETDKVNALIPLLAYFSGKFPEGSNHPHKITQKALSSVKKLKKCPTYDSSIVKKHIGWLKSSGVLK